MTADEKQNMENCEIVRFKEPWTSPFRVDGRYPFHLVNREGRHLFIINKTAWAFFACENPEGVLKKAKEEGCNVIRVALEGRLYFESLGYDLWPWLGTREQPDWSGFNSVYWEEVEKRIRLAGNMGIGIDLVIYFTLKPEAEEVPHHRPYWRQILSRLEKYSNIVTWEIANEYTKNEAFQDEAGRFLAENDSFGRPVCSSDGTTDDALWPSKGWVGLAINHTCTSSTEKHPLDQWYRAVAYNTRSHGKPAFCNESGRESRHRNDDPVHRRKQAWIWYCCGCFWTHHTWDGCEGINDMLYTAPGTEFIKPLGSFFEALEFWKLNPNLTVVQGEGPEHLCTVLADEQRHVTVAYLCTHSTGKKVTGSAVRLRLPDGDYKIHFIDPATLAEVGVVDIVSDSLGKQYSLKLPDFTDDLLIKIVVKKVMERTAIEGTL